MKPLNRESDRKTAFTLQDNTLGEVNCRKAVGNCAHESRAHSTHFCTHFAAVIRVRVRVARDDVLGALENYWHDRNDFALDVIENGDDAY